MTLLESTTCTNRRTTPLRGRRTGGVLLKLLVLLILAVGLGLAAFALVGNDNADATVSKLDAGDLHTVARSSFEIVIPASGELTTELCLAAKSHTDAAC